MRDLGPAERFWLGAVGRPGQRTFYAAVVADGEAFWFHAEKQQVATFAQRSLEVLGEAGLEPDLGAVDLIIAHETMDEPDEPLFSLGAVTLAIEPDVALIRIVFESTDDEIGVSFDLVPEQLQAAAQQGLTAVGQGRPLCPLCRLPQDPDGHECPAVNGHRR